MKNNMMLMSCEIEKLRVELAIAKNRVRAVATVAPSPAYPAGYGVPSTGCGGNMYPNSYDDGTKYGRVNYNPYAPYDTQQLHIS
nr:protein FLX-like 1 isoform X1 [Ipomoea batatas]